MEGEERQYKKSNNLLLERRDTMLFTMKEICFNEIKKDSYITFNKGENQKSKNNNNKIPEKREKIGKNNIIKNYITNNNLTLIIII